MKRKKTTHDQKAKKKLHLFKPPSYWFILIDLVSILLSFLLFVCNRNPVNMFTPLAWVYGGKTRGRNSSIVDFLWGQEELQSKRETECVIKEAVTDNENRKAGK